MRTTDDSNITKKTIVHFCESAEKLFVQCNISLQKKASYLMQDERVEVEWKLLETLKNNNIGSKCLFSACIRQTNKNKFHNDSDIETSGRDYF